MTEHSSASYVEHLFMCLLTICMSSYESFLRVAIKDHNMFWGSEIKMKFKMFFLVDF